MGNGRVPTGRKAWLIDWTYFLFMEANAVSKGQKSLPWSPNGSRFDVTMDFAKSYELDWNEGGWSIPNLHPIVEVFPNILSLPPLFAPVELPAGVAA